MASYIFGARYPNGRKLPEGMTTQRQIRAAFWAAFPNLDRKRIGKGDDRRYCTDTRRAFVDYIDSLCRDGEISPELAQRATLEG